MESYGLEIYKGVAAKAVENIFFDELSEKLKNIFLKKKISGVLIGNPACKDNPTLAPDILLMTKHSVLIIDLKNYEENGAIELPSQMFFERGQWIYKKGNDEVIIKGGSTSNPFNQVAMQRKKLIDLVGNSIDNFNPRHICTGILFQNHIKINQNDIPNKYRNRFFICDKNSCLQKIFNFINVEDEEVNLNRDDMLKILEYFDAEPYISASEMASSVSNINLDNAPRKIESALEKKDIPKMITKLEPELKAALDGAESIDILTAYFYFSGFSRIANELKDKKIRILVGKAIDPNDIPELTYKVRNGNASSIDLDDYSVKRINEKSRTARKDLYIQSFVEMFNKSSLTDLFDKDDGAVMKNIFEKKLLDGSMEIRMVQNRSEHSKRYVIKNSQKKIEKTGKKGVVFMGSSNFTYSGLIGQGETNEKFYFDEKVDEYEGDFEKLWNSSDAVDIQTNNGNNDFLEKIQKKLFIHSTPDPYKVYARILYELYSTSENENDIQLPSTISDGKFMNFRYQIDAIKQGIDCLNKYNGVIVADVVGLGKSIVGSAIANNMDMRTIIITPPHLKKQWEDYANDFRLKNRIIESSGMIESLHKRFANDSIPTLYIIDEAHRYRNELTDDYQYLHQLTRSNKDNKVILLTATPYNNKPEDIFALIKLFQTPSRSTLNTVDNLSTRFQMLIAEYNRLHKKGKKNPESVKSELKELSSILRSMIEPVVIRRSRIDLKEIKEYAEDLRIQNITFPEVVGPELIEVDLNELGDLYQNTLISLVDEDDGFKGARYQTAGYVVDAEKFEKHIMRYLDISDLKTAQTNIAKFMRRLLVMRFESSKFAFKETLDKIIRSNEIMLKWWNRGYIPIRKKGIILDPESLNDSNDDDIDEIFKSIEDNEDIDIEKYKKIGIPVPASYFSESLVEDIRCDIRMLEQIKREWFPDGRVGHDPKIDDVSYKIKQFLKEDPNRKIVIFSTYADTAEYVCKELVKTGVRALLYHGSSSASIKSEVLKNFDASLKESEQENNYDVIVATDALSEGFNLHRAGIIINYDIPYNPTRVIQRIGRINRINKKMFDKIYIYNCFPTSIGDEIVNIKGISTLKMLLINNIVGSDSNTLTDDEELTSYFRRKYEEANDEIDEKSWDIEFKNDYNIIKDNASLINELLEIPEHTRIVRKNQKQDIAVSFAKRGNSYLFATADNYDEVAEIQPAEDVLKFFKAGIDEKSFESDDELDRKFTYLKKEITKPHEISQLSKRRQEALNNLQFLKDNYPSERDYLTDLYDVIHEYDDFSEGELKFIAQLFNRIKSSSDNIDENMLKVMVFELHEKFSVHYIESIREKSEDIAKISETIMFTEDIRK